MSKVVHFLPFKTSWNTRCLTGSPHEKRTDNLKHVTCFKCLNPQTESLFWGEYEKKHGNQHRNF